MRSSWLLCFLLIFWIRSIIGNVIPDFKVVPTGYFNKVEATPYEITAKIVYKIAVPSINFQSPGKCSQTDVTCIYKMSIYNSYQEYSRILHNVMVNHPSRPKRQVGILLGAAGGYLLHSVVDKISHTFFGTEAGVQKDIEKIAEAMKQNNKQFLLFQQSVGSFAYNVTNKLVELDNNQKDIFVAMRLQLLLAQISGRFNSLEMGIQSCINGFVPFTLIDSKALRKSLEQVSSTVQSHGYFLSMPLGSIERYYKVSLADCVLTDSHLHVMINVPLSKSVWTIYEALPVPFSVENQTCYISNSESSLLAVGEDLLVMDGYARQFCDVQKDRLCQIPTLSKPSAHRTSCLAAMYKQEGPSAVTAYCTFKCEASNDPVTYQVSPTKIVTVNSASIEVSCPSVKQSYYPDRVGAVEISIKCNCTYKIGGRTIDSFPSCLQTQHLSTDVISIVPDVLADPAKYIASIPMRSQAKSSILNSNWILPLSNMTLVTPETGHAIGLHEIRIGMYVLFGGLVGLLLSFVVGLRWMFRRTK